MTTDTTVDTHMKNEFTLKDFKPALSIASLILRKAGLPVGAQANPVLYSKAGRVMVGAWNYEYGCAIDVTRSDDTIAGGWALTIPSDMKFGRRGWDYPTFDPVKRELSTWRDESRILKPAHDYTYLPDSVDGGRSAWFEVGVYALINALNFVQPGLALEDNRPILTAVHIRTIPGVGIQVESADGYRAHRYTIPDTAIRDTFDCLLPGHMIPALVEFLTVGNEKTTARSVSVGAIKDGYIEIAGLSGFNRFVFMPLDGKFPLLDQVLHIDPSNKSYVRTAELVGYAAHEFIRPAMNNQSVALLVKDGHTRLLTPDFSIDNPDTESIAVDRAMPISWDNPTADNFWIGFNPRYLYQSLRAMGALTFTAQTVVKGRGMQCAPIHFTAPGRQVTLMPMSFDHNHGWGPSVDAVFADGLFAPVTSADITAITMSDRERAVELETAIKRMKIELSALQTD